jgi:capsular polysaccharide biosynthesis protein
MITPAYVAQQMKQYFVPKYEEKGASGVKLYITRHGQWRNMTNNNEVETYFESIGFQVIEAHKLDYDTKIQLFQNATEIVGPYSSGFANLVFCRPNTKVLVFSNIQRTLENFLAFYVQNFQLDAMYVTGYDEMPSDPDSPFTISLERIQPAYEELIKK